MTDGQLLTNVQAVQKRQNLTPARSLDDFTEVDRKGQVKPKAKNYKPGAKLNLDIEMETGTGKTYCYIKTMLEMNKRYGWSKFIVMVPSIAIREGVYKSLQVTADHFTETLRQESAVLYLQFKTSARAGELLLRRRDQCDDHQHPGFQCARRRQSPDI